MALNVGPCGADHAFVWGDTKPVKDQLKKLDGAWVPKAKGWVIPNTSVAKVRKVLGLTTGISVTKPKSKPKVPSKVSAKKPSQKSEEKGGHLRIPTLTDDLKAFYRKPLPVDVVQTRRGYLIRAYLHQKHGVDRVGQMTSKLLRELFDGYDHIAFGGQISHEITKRKYKFKVVLSDRKTTGVAGKCTSKGKRGEQACEYTLTLYKPHFFDLFKGQEGVRKLRNAGIECTRELECFAITLEHEMVHLMLALGMYPPDDIHGANFKFFVSHMFGHKDTKHELGEGFTDEPGKVTKENLKIGDKVYYVSKKGSKLRVEGKVEKLNPKTAKVGAARVPYAMLRKL
jgi:hypothetical protein